MSDSELIPHLFRTEYSKIIAVLCRRFGIERIGMAEDIAGETFLTATQSWGLNGVPPNPVAWLYNVAKNKARTLLQRDHVFDRKIAAELRDRPVDADGYVQPGEEIDLSPQHINDSQLQMMFCICHPSISAEAQIGLSLRILCGFGIEEIADAFLTSKETINKRLFRAKEKLREEKIQIGLPGPSEIGERLEGVLATIYLLFNEGYYSLSQDKKVRKDLCLEAMRLCTMLVENNSIDSPSAAALLALMCFHASRFEARQNESGEMILYEEQDTSLWNTDLISKGGYFLRRAASGDRLSRYHLEAGIAYWHTQGGDTKEKWENILQLYNHLLQMEYSPVAALNRTYALSRADGKEVAIAEAEKLPMEGNPFYHALLGELYCGIDDPKAVLHFGKALALARTDADRHALQRRRDKLF